MIYIFKIQKINNNFLFFVLYLNIATSKMNANEILFNKITKRFCSASVHKINFQPNIPSEILFNLEFNFHPDIPSKFKPIKQNKKDETQASPVNLNTSTDMLNKIPQYNNSAIIDELFPELNDNVKIHDDNEYYPHKKSKQCYIKKTKTLKKYVCEICKSNHKSEECIYRCKECAKHYFYIHKKDCMLHKQNEY